MSWGFKSIHCIHPTFFPKPEIDNPVLAFENQNGYVEDIVRFLERFLGGACVEALDPNISKNDEELQLSNDQRDLLFAQREERLKEVEDGQQNITKQQKSMAKIIQAMDDLRPFKTCRVSTYLKHSKQFKTSETVG